MIWIIEPLIWYNIKDRGGITIFFSGPKILNKFALPFSISDNLGVADLLIIIL